MNCCIERRNIIVGDSKGYWMPAATNNYLQKQFLLPMNPLSASGFRVNENSNYSCLDSTNATGVNFAGGNHTGDLDRFILLQIEQLISTIQQQFSSFSMNLEAKFLMILTQKDRNLAQEKNKVMKITQILKKTLAEKEKWKKIAWKLTIMLTTLKGRLEQVQKPSFSSTGETKREEEVESCFSTHINEEKEEKDEIFVDEPSSKRHKRNISSLCQKCSLSSACVIILPCRHLCLCKNCDVLEFRCPVCKCVKRETLEVVF